MIFIVYLRSPCHQYIRSLLIDLTLPFYELVLKGVVIPTNPFHANIPCDHVL
jgi:hypothetical protein